MFLWVKNIPTDTQKKNESKTHSWISISILFPTMTLTYAILMIHRFYRQHLMRYSTALSFPASMLNRKHVLLGVVTSVGDADNFRLFHTPGGFLAGWHWLRSIPSLRKDLKDQTIHIRLAGIDAPELNHFGKEAQPYGKEAMEWLTSYILGKRVRVRIFTRDRYERILGTVETRHWPFIWIRKNVALEMIKLGLAEVYKSRGAEYGGKIMEIRYLYEEQKAKRKKIGIWKQGIKTYESPAEYKRRMFVSTPTFFSNKTKK
ncbi:hypothetical protein PCANB_000756 [Pneumocystis canis]|nr:hypothetical protein PCK1_000868 [Pneumocystis canis]KAG5437327.1 hypothetical protein PCANB_000756 [Pneumocystis canis]